MHEPSGPRGSPTARKGKSFSSEQHQQHPAASAGTTTTKHLGTSPGTSSDAIA